jgi:nucleoside-diphosphate-sugar epimerase
MSRRVLLTGASGFLGWPTLAALLRGGNEVHAVTTRTSPPQLDGVHWHMVDLLAGAGVEELVCELRPESLVHLAWYVEHGRFWEAPENLLWVERSLSLVRLFAESGGRRALLLGSCAEYDWSRAQRPLREADSPIGPTTLYGVAKDALRRVCCAYAEREGFELAWGRLFFLYGPREAPGRLVSSVIGSLLAGEAVATTAGAQRRDFLHVHDAADAIVGLLESAVTGPVNIASGDASTVAEVVEQIAVATGRGDLIERAGRPERPNEPGLLVADVARLREEVGFRPAIDLVDGIADTVSWWRERARAGSPALPAQGGAALDG